MSKFHSTSEVATVTGKSRTSIWRECLKHPGFAVAFGAQLRIPDDHLRRLLAGEPIKQIAADARAKALGAPRAA